MRKFFTFFLIFLSSLAINAQNSVSASAGKEGGVEEHRYEGMSITYAPVIESADVFSSVSYSWKSTADGTVVDLGNTAKLVYTIPSIGATTGKQVDISVAISGTPKDTLTLPLDTTIHYMLYVYPQPVSTQNAYAANLYVGDETTLSLTTAGGKAGAWTYVWDNAGGTTDSYTFSADKVGESQVVKVIVKNSLGNAYDFVDTLTYSINVWNKCTITQNDYPKAMYVDDEVSLSLDPSGGKIDGWSYQWENSSANSNTYTFKPTSAGVHQIQVKVKNSLNNTDPQYDFSQTLTYTIQVWEKCNASIVGKDGLHCYTGEEFTYRTSVSGGDSNKWSYEWYVNDVLEATTPTYTIQAPVVEGENKDQVVVKVKISNTPDSIYKAYTYQQTCTLNVWPIGSVEKPTIECGYYHNDNVVFSLNTIGGYEQGWTYRWTDGVNSSTRKDFQIQLRNTSNNTEKRTVQVEWKNAIGSQVGSQGVETFEVDVYPNAKAPTFTSKVVRMRDIDQITIDATAGTGGNPDGWMYSWNGEPVTTDLSYVISDRDIPSNTKQKLTDTITLEWMNKDSSGKIRKSDKVSIILSIYNTPANPVLKMKGNGTSNIFIVDDMGMTEEDLWSKGYCFRFWDGSSLVEEVNDQRWCRYDHAPTNAWVQSVWYYEDGFVCEGEAVAATIGYYSPSSKTTVSIYRADGELVRKTTVDEMNTMENIYTTLEAGLYIVKTVNNGMVNTCKIVIR